MSDNTNIISDDAARAAWKAAGGAFHGPNVETGYMPEAKLLPFLRGIHTEAEAEVAAMEEKLAKHMAEHPLTQVDADYITERVKEAAAEIEGLKAQNESLTKELASTKAMSEIYMNKLHDICHEVEPSIFDEPHDYQVITNTAIEVVKDIKAKLARYRALETSRQIGKIEALTKELAAEQAAHEQVRVQLAGCGAAALGYAGDCKVTDYGYSASLRDVIRLRWCYDQARAGVESLTKELEEKDKLAKWATKHADEARAKVEPLTKELDAAKAEIKEAEERDGAAWRQIGRSMQEVEALNDKVEAMTELLRHLRCNHSALLIPTNLSAEEQARIAAVAGKA